MSRQSYPTPLTAVSTDIEVVGGKNAVVGDQRDDLDGNKYILVLASGTIAVNRGCKFSTDLTIVAHTTYVGYPLGITVSAVDALDYSWVQIGGIATVVTNQSVDYGESIFFTTAGVARGSAIGTDLGAGVYMALGTALTSDGSGTSARILIDRHCWTHPA